MKIAVIGGTGLIGSQVVKLLNEEGHKAVPHSSSTGVDLLTGNGLTAALDRADVVVDLSNSPTFDEASLAFFQTSMDNLLSAAAAAGVGHAVILSIVGVDKVPDDPYYRAKVLQEELLKTDPVPYSIVRSTQFDEFLNALINQFPDDADPVRLPTTKVQPIASADIARAVADVVVGAPLNGTRNVAGPEVFTLDELGRITLEAKGDTRTVVGDDSVSDGDARILGDGDDALIAKTTYREWLASR
ncbi:SDR family oxidoreductase [Streptomyces chiangmaiensis]|uniref:SDR family oxidoreductase n=1 Tax=Streptomyces chiangmaiensis TaxID=766497 RepID=A0ABU7FWG8_9ACTN|nr:SDR family oxidoreductase [Streptomyces chiangmaiensis]MED7828446.1 SDR family oxidoreductase [Streptomyces chiangmaiensis]